MHNSLYNSFKDGVCTVNHSTSEIITFQRPGGVNLVQNVGGRHVQGVWGQNSSSGVQGRSPGRGSGGQSPPEAEAILDFYMHNFDLILNYFCFARAMLLAGG